MVKCYICGKEGVIFARGKWWCEKHYDPTENEQKNDVEDKLDKIKGTLDFGLKKLYKTDDSHKGAPL